MKDYVLLNKDKLIWTFNWTSIILTVAFVIWTYYTCDNGDCYDKTKIAYGFLMTLLVLPTFSIVFEIIPGFIEYKRTEKLFDSEPIKELIKNGFKKDLTEKSSKWFLSKLSTVGQFDKYEMVCEVESGRLRIIARINYEHLDNWDINDIKAIQQSFKHVRFEYDGDGIATSLKVSRVKKMTYKELENYLREFVKMLDKLKLGEGPGAHNTVHMP